MIKTQVHHEVIQLCVLTEAAFGDFLDAQEREEVKRRLAPTAKVNIERLQDDISMMRGVLRDERGWTSEQRSQLLVDCHQLHVAVAVGGDAGLPQLLALGRARRWTAAILWWVLGFERGVWDHPGLAAHLHPWQTWIAEPVPNVVRTLLVKVDIASDQPTYLPRWEVRPHADAPVIPDDADERATFLYASPIYIPRYG